jgi:hypothetical protein
MNSGQALYPLLLKEREFRPFSFKRRRVWDEVVILL